ncbi:MAG: hypothetical protein PHT12_04040 [Patescibacteria group bacterium]|nr:hypothetical protein [Patescibacteria group bacterium]
MRSLTVSVLLTALALVACAAPQKPAATQAAVETAAPTAAKAKPRLHVKLSLPPGWFVVQGSKIDWEDSHAVELVNPTLSAKGTIAFQPSSVVVPMESCELNYEAALDGDARILQVGEAPDGSACGFIWFGPSKRVIGGMMSLSVPGNDGWTAAIFLRYPANYKANFLQRDIETLANSLELERR